MLAANSNCSTLVRAIGEPCYSCGQNTGTIPPALADVKAGLDDVDLEPYVARWHCSLVARGIAAAEDYLVQVRRFIPEGVPFPRSEFTRARVREFIDGLCSGRRTRRNRESLPAITGATRNRYRNAIGVFARWLVDEHDGVLEHNPVRDIRRAKEVARSVIYYSSRSAPAHRRASRAMSACCLPSWHRREWSGKP